MTAAEAPRPCRGYNCGNGVGVSKREFCAMCWKFVPKIVRDLMLDEYREGQGVKGKPPSFDYTCAVRTACACVEFRKRHRVAPSKEAVLKLQHSLAAKMRQEIAELIGRKIELSDGVEAPPASPGVPGESVKGKRA